MCFVKLQANPGSHTRHHQNEERRKGAISELHIYGNVHGGEDEPAKRGRPPFSRAISAVASILACARRKALEKGLPNVGGGGERVAK